MTPIELTGFAAIIAGTIGLGLACRAQRREIERLRVQGLAQLMWGNDLNDAITAIADATRNGKSGTAKMVHRMAMEGLNYEQA